MGSAGSALAWLRAAALATALVFAPPVTAQSEGERAFLLVAHPDLDDENFSGTVVLVIDQGEGGPLGVILNRPTGVRMSQVYPERPGFRDRNDMLFVGGPVQPDALLFAFRSPQPPAKGLLVDEDIYISGFGEVLEELLRHPEQAAEQRFFTGYAGWAAGQLETEIERGGWYVLQLDTHAIFEMNPLTLYEEMLRRATTPSIEARAAGARPAAH